MLPSPSSAFLDFLALDLVEFFLQEFFIESPRLGGLCSVPRGGLSWAWDRRVSGRRLGYGDARQAAD